MKKDVKKKFTKILIILFVAGIAIVAMNQKPVEAGIVQERTVDQSSTLFFDYTIVRYPARVEALTPTTSSENLTIGFNVDTDELDFSRVEVGSSVKKMINLTTTDGRVSKISVVGKGSIKPLLKFGKTNFLLKGSDTVEVIMDSGKQEAGNYTGEVDVIIQRSNNDILRGFLGY